MPVTVKIPTIFRRFVGGHAVVEATVNGSSTLNDLLDDLEERYPGIRSTVVTDEGALHRFVNLYVNNEDVRYLGSLQTPVREGDTVSILPAVAGGV
jgi:sulfur-carrier protein